MKPGFGILFLMVLASSNVHQILTEAADMELEASPTSLLVGLTTDMFVNCTVKLDDIDDNSALTGVVSLTVFRGDTSNTKFYQLASLSVFSPDKVNLMTQEAVTSSGRIDTNGISYIYLHWENPTAELSGMYRCSAQGLDNLGRSVVLTDSAVITTDNVDTNDLLDKVREMGVYTQSLEDKILKLEKAVENITVMESQIDALEFFHLKIEASPLNYQNHKYYIPKIHYQDISVSHAFCQMSGGSLVIINDTDEYQAIQKYVSQFTHFDRLIVAGTDEKVDGTWILSSSNDPIPFSDWYDSTGTDENCLSLRQDKFWRMDDYVCHHSSPQSDARFMCEMA